MIGRGNRKLKRAPVETGKRLTNAEFRTGDWCLSLPPRVLSEGHVQMLTEG